MKNFNETDGAAMAIGRTVSGQSWKAASAALLTLTLSMGISGCSHSKQQTSGSSQNSTQSQTAQVTPAVPVTPTASQPAVAKKKSVKGPVKKLPATKTFNDEVSGLSFTYPRRSILELGDKAEQDGVVAEQLPMKFVQDGGVTTAVVTLPGIAKSGSDYTPAFFAISINKGLTAEQCGEFTGTVAEDKVNTDSADETVFSSDAQKLTIGNVEYVELDKATEHGAAKYYHRFVPGSVPEDNACYEFAMSVKSAEPKQDGDKSSSDQKTATQAAPSLSDEHKAAFASLEKILTSVNFKGEAKNDTVASSVQTANNKQ